MSNLAFVFPGQGSQCVGMGKDLCKETPIAGRVFENANDVLGFDLQKLCFEGPLDELTKTENTQPALLTYAYALFDIYMDRVGIAPKLSAGHSLGEYSALVCCGAMNFQDALKIVRKRGHFMQEAAALGTGTMAAVSGIEENIIEEKCKKYSAEEACVGIACYNTPEQIVISGMKEAVEGVTKELAALGARCVKLNVSAPFHSLLMQTAASRLNEELSKHQYNGFEWPVISNVTALPYLSKNEIPENLTSQMIKPVLWKHSMEYFCRQEIDIVIEMGPQAVLKNMMKKISKNVAAYSYEKREEQEAVRNLLSSNQVNKPVKTIKKMDVLTRCMAIAVCTKNNNWDNEEYQKGVVEPYRKVKELQERLESENKEPTLKQINEVVEMLRSVFITKKTPIEEQIERFNQLIDETGTRELFSDFKIAIN